MPQSLPPDTLAEYRHFGQLNRDFIPIGRSRTAYPPLEPIAVSFGQQKGSNLVSHFFGRRKRLRRSPATFATRAKCPAFLHQPALEDLAKTTDTAQ
jgi:hypothetical protein